MIFLTFFEESWGAVVREVSVLAVARSVVVIAGMASSSTTSNGSVADGMIAGGRVSTSAMTDG